MKALLAAALLLAIPASARAEISYPDQRPATAQVTQFVNGSARSFWEDRNVWACQGQQIKVWVAPVLDGSDGSAWGRGGDCTVYLTQWLVRDLTAEADMKAPVRLRRGLKEDMAKACTAVTHETGHALGLPHSPTGVMAVTGVVEPPWYCRVWARHLTMGW